MNYEKWRMHYETLPDGTRAQVRDGYTMRDGYFTRDGHGGHAFEHHQEMRQIALATINDCLLYTSDAADDMHNVFNSEKFRNVISTKIMDSIKKNLNNPNIRIK